MHNAVRPNNPELKAAKVPTEIDIAWAAGIYEGEGCCRLAGKTKRGLMVQVAQKDPELLYRLRDWFGGSVSNKRKSTTCHSWDACGDRARIFLALIYEFMTVRRKGQIDAANGLEFLRGQSPVGLGLDKLNAILESFYIDHSNMVKERKRKAANDKYRRLSSDPEWKKKDREKKAIMRANMTPEQKAEMSRYQHERYLRKKAKKQESLAEVQINDTA